MADPIQVESSYTPNPNSMKFTVNRTVLEKGTKTFSSKAVAAEHPLAKSLFDLPGVQMVFFMGNFISVTRDPNSDWNVLAPAVEKKITEHYAKS